MAGVPPPPQQFIKTLNGALTVLGRVSRGSGLPQKFGLTRLRNPIPTSSLVQGLPFYKGAVCFVVGVCSLPCARPVPVLCSGGLIKEIKREERGTCSFSPSGEHFVCTMGQVWLDTEVYDRDLQLLWHVTSEPLGLAGFHFWGSLVGIDRLNVPAIDHSSR